MVDRFLNKNKNTGIEGELWSIKEKKIYPQHNTRYKIIDGVIILTTPSGEPLVVRKR